MRTLLIILGFAFLIGSCHSQKLDRIILKKEKYGEVYITHDTTIREYKWLVPLDLTKENFPLYDYHFNDLLNDSLVKINHFQFGKLPLKWTPLYIIDDKYYLYGPADWMFNFGYAIKDSVIVDQYSDGPAVMIILDYQQKSESEYWFKLFSKNKIEYLTIKIVDSKNGIAVWEFERGKNLGHTLMVDSRNVKLFPLVNCDCGEVKCIIDYKFKTPNFEKIIKNAR